MVPIAIMERVQDFEFGLMEVEDTWVNSNGGKGSVWRQFGGARMARFHPSQHVFSYRNACWTVTSSTGNAFKGPAEKNVEAANIRSFLG